MLAMAISRVTSLRDDPAPLELVELPIPRPGPGELLVKVAACGACHTELDEIEGRTTPPELPVVAGHEVVGWVAEVGSGGVPFPGGGSRRRGLDPLLLG